MRRSLIAWLALAGAALVSGCAPMAAPMPFSTMQRADPLPKNTTATAVGAGIGVGGVGWPEGAAGGALSYRLGTGNGNELSLSGHAITYGCSGCVEAKRGSHLAIAGRAGARGQLGPGSAWLVGLGYAGGAGGTALGADIGVVKNVFRSGYVSARAGIAEPVTREPVFNEDEGDAAPLAESTGFGVFAAGVRLGDRSAFIAEVGFALIETPSAGGAAVYGLIGIDVLRLAD